MRKTRKIRLPENPMGPQEREDERDFLGKSHYEAYVLCRRLTLLISRTLRADPEWMRMYRAWEKAAMRFHRRGYIH